MTVSIGIEVVPNSCKQRIIITSNQIIKCYMTNLPEKGRANGELIAFLAKHLKIAKRSIHISCGETSRKKTILIESHFSKQEILSVLGLETQTRLVTL